MHDRLFANSKELAREDLLTHAEAVGLDKERFAVDLDKHWRPSSKLNALMGDLHETLATPLPPVDPNAVLPAGGKLPSVRKAVVISQWTSMLDLVQRALGAAGIGYERLDGSMSQAQRGHALARFADDDEAAVMLLSLLP